MSVVRTYFDIVARWRWSLLLALLIGAFILQALLEKTGISRLAGLVLFVMIFAGAIHAGRVGPIAKRSALVCLVLAPLLQLPTKISQDCKVFLQLHHFLGVYWITSRERGWNGFPWLVWLPVVEDIVRLIISHCLAVMNYCSSIPH